MSALLEQPWTVIEIGESISASTCGQLLGRLGATVIKVEPPDGSPLRSIPPLIEAADGDVLSTHYAYLNGAKQVVTADLDSPDGRSEVERLISADCAVVVMSGTLEEWAQRGLPLGRVRELAPRSVIGRITRFGDDGPHRDLLGGEMQFQALGGLMHVIGDPDRPPIRIGGAAAEYAAGVSLFTGIVFGLHRQRAEGIGAELTTSVFEMLPYLVWKNAVSYQADGAIETRGEDGLPLILRCKDGFSAFYYRGDDWAEVQKIFDDPRLHAPEFETQALRQENRAKLIEVLSENTINWAKKDLYHRAQSGGIPAGYIATMGDLLESDQYLARECLDQVDLGKFGVGTIPGAPWKIVTASGSATVDVG